MPVYTETGALNVVTNDTTKGRYSPTGALRVNLVSGASYTGLYATDGALNVVDVSGVSISTYGGLYHPCGALRGRTAPDTFSGLQAPDGSYYLRGLFSPLNLFSNGEVGGWYDPSDLTTLFQDAAGTTPVTAVEQPVGLILDKSKGLTLGSELVTNGTFDSDTAWTKGTGWTISGGAAQHAAGTASNLDQAIALISGKSYKITVYAIASGGTWALQFAGGTTTTVGSALSTGSYSFIGVAASGNITLRIYAGSATALTIDNISVRELPGSHLSQSTSTARPVLSARVNLLTRTEEFDNAVWQISAAGVATVTKSTTNAGVAPDGTTTADRVLFNLNGGTTTTDVALLRQAAGSAGEYTFSIAVRSFDGTSSYVMQLIKPDGTGQNITVTGSWQRFTVSGAASGAINYGIRLRGGQSPANSDSADVLLWGADLRPSNAGVGLPAYQRVGAATSGTSSAAGNADYDTTGFPYYLRWDGTDDGMATGSIDFSGTDKMALVAGVRKITDTVGMIVELSSGFGNSGSMFAVSGTDNGFTAGYSSASRGTATGSSTQAAGISSLAAPHTAVLSASHDISGDLSTLRANGTNGTNSTVDKGAGNFGNYPLYVGSRNNASVRFNGYIYGLVIVGRALTAGEIASMETWMNSKTRAY